MSNVTLNYAQIIDPLSFKSINLAKIYIGEYGTLPNPANASTWKQAYFVNSDGTRTAASQPIRTNAAGYAVDGSGNIKTVQVDGGYSLLVQDQFNATKFSTAKAAEIWSDLSASSGADLVGAISSLPGAVETTAAEIFDRTVSVFDFMTEEQRINVQLRLATIDVTAPLQAAFNSAKSVIIETGAYLFTSLIVPNTLRQVIGKGGTSTDTFLKRATGATGAAFKWNGVTRNVGTVMSGFRMDGNGEASETYGLDLSGFSYCRFEDIWVRAFKLDGIYADGSIAPVNQQFSNNTFINVRSNNNQRDGWRFPNVVNANSANTYVGCEGQGNGGRGFNELSGFSNQCVGCTFQGNTGRDFYSDGVRGIYEFYSESAQLAVELGSASYGNELSVRSSFPAWNTFIDNGTQNRKRIRGFDGVMRHLFNNPYGVEWYGGTAPTGLTALGSCAFGSVADANSPYKFDVTTTITANTSGFRMSLAKSAAELAGKWVTLVLDVDTSGITGTPNIRVYSTIDGTSNAAAGEFVATQLKITAPGQYTRLFYDVRFASTAGTTATLSVYPIYDGYTSSSVIKIRSAHVLEGQALEIADMSVTDPVPSVTTAQLSSAANGINIHRKTSGRMVYESSTGKLRFAIGTTPASAWRATDGSGDVTPS